MPYRMTVAELYTASRGTAMRSDLLFNLYPCIASKPRPRYTELVEFS